MIHPYKRIYIIILFVIYFLIFGCSDSVKSDDPPPPYPPTNIFVSLIDYSISLNWTLSVSNSVYSYLIFKNGSYYAFVDSSISQYLDDDYNYNEEVCYYLKATTIAGIESNQTQEACITTPINPDNIYDIRIEIRGSQGNQSIVEIYQNSIEPDNLKYVSRNLNDNDIAIDYNVLQEGLGYIVRGKYQYGGNWYYGSYTIFDGLYDVNIFMNAIYSTPIVTEWEH